MNLLLGFFFAFTIIVIIWVLLLTALMGRAYNRLAKLDILCNQLIVFNTQWCKELTAKNEGIKAAVDNVVNSIESQVKSETKTWN